VIASPLRPRTQRQESGIAARGRLTHPRNALRRFTFVRDHDTPMASFRPALTETPAAHNQAALEAARSIPGRALASSVSGSPYQGPGTGLPPPISTSVPGTPPPRYARRPSRRQPRLIFRRAIRQHQHQQQPTPGGATSSQPIAPGPVQAIVLTRGSSHPVRRSAVARTNFQWAKRSGARSSSPFHHRQNLR
jgi:hypothetical protein